MAKFKPGQSGNPGGKPKGARDKRTVLRSLLEPHADDLAKKAVELALNGDVAALRLCLERLIPPIRGRDEPVNIGPLRGSLSAQARQITRAIAGGKLIPSEGSSILAALASQAKIHEHEELAERLSILEERLNGNGETKS